MAIISHCNQKKYSTLTAAMLEAAWRKRATGRIVSVTYCTMCQSHHVGNQRQITEAEIYARAAARVIDRFDDLG
jgi:hypothetical protein